MSPTLRADQLVAGRYAIGELLEETPAYAAYRVFDREVEVEMSLWHLRDALFPDPARRRGFVGAVAAMRGVSHPNLRRMFDAGDDAGVLWATVQRHTDDGLLPRPGDGQRLGDEALLHYGQSVSDALEAAHAAGHIHGHLIPSDVVHVAGLIKVGGVGLFGHVNPTAARAAFVTHERFIAPEVLAGGGATVTSDVYSLAALLAELATGRSADDVSATAAHLHAGQSELGEVLRAGLAIAPERRPAGPAALVYRVAAALGLEATTAEARPVGGMDDDAVPTAEQRPLRDVDPIPRGPLLGPDPDSVARPPTGKPEPRSDPGPTRRMRPQGKHSPDFAEAADIETMVEQPWVAAKGEPPPADQVPASVRGGPFSPAPPVEAPPAPPVEAPPARREPVMVSRKPVEANRPAQARRVPVLDRPEMRPVVRPISEARGGSTAPPLGRYAPPRTGAQAAAPTKSRLVPIVIAGGALLVVAAGVVAFLQFGRGHGAARATPDAAPARAAPPPVVTVEEADAAVVGPCPRAMVLATLDQHRYCIDAYESPGEGRLPQAGLTLEQAADDCRQAGKRLCTGDEWEEGCRGEHGVSWPYGDSFRRTVCNVDRGVEAIAATGVHPGCVSAVGAFDMSGNVAEWVRGGEVRGGSASDGGDGRCSRVSRRGREGVGYSDVGFRCCVDAQNQ